MEYGFERDPSTADMSPAGLARRIAGILETLLRFHGARCPGCGRPFCAHETLMSLVLGYKDAPHCLPCVSRAVGRDPDALGAEICAYILTKECLLVGWRWAQMREESCPWRAGAPVPAQAPAPPDPGVADAPSPDATWDAGDMACGELLLELRTRMQSMRPGTFLKITALDASAPEDLPAWCRLTGHRLVIARHPDYWIRRKED